MASNCPNCDKTGIGGQIVELSHPFTEEKFAGVICPRCGTVYHSSRAETQVKQAQHKSN